MKKYYFIEQVALSSKIGYSFPDVLKSSEIEALINTIESDPAIVKLIQSQEASSQEIWNKLAQTNVGKELLQKNKSLLKYRISGESLGNRDAFEKGAYNQQRENDPRSTTPMHYYDKWANGGGQNTQTKGMPSFKEFFDPTKGSEWRTHEVSGAGSKESLTGVVTQKQTPLKKNS